MQAGFHLHLVMEIFVKRFNSVNDNCKLDRDVKRRVKEVKVKKV